MALSGGGCQTKVDSFGGWMVNTNLSHSTTQYQRMTFWSHPDKAALLPGTGSGARLYACGSASEGKGDVNFLADPQAFSLAIEQDRVHSEGDAAIDFGVDTIGSQDVEGITAEFAG